MNAAEMIYLLVVILCDVQFGSVDILGGKKLYVFFGLIFFFFSECENPRKRRSLAEF